MARPSSIEHLTDILAAAEHWKNRCLLEDRSVFSEAHLWSAENVELLDRYFVQSPLAGKASFLEKFKTQLEPSPAEVRQLGAEMLWLLLLFPSDIGGEKKRENVLKVWSWSGQPLDSSRHSLFKVLDYGIGSSGTAYHIKRASELVFLITLMKHWKTEGTSRQSSLLADPWRFGNWIDSVPMPETGERQFRHMLLYLLFPDTYERISSVSNKRDIVHSKTFSILLESFTPVQGDSERITVDRKLQAIRIGLEKEYSNQEIDFYEPPIKERWKLKGEPPPPPPPPPPSPYSADKALEGIFLKKSDFEEILAILRSKRNAILQGPPGVGKSFIARRLAYALIEAEDDEHVQVIQFHQSYSYEDFVEGYRPTGKGEFQLKPGLFRELCCKAQEDPQSYYVLVIDEINRGNLSKIFGELLLLIEYDKRDIKYQLKLAYSGDTFFVPPNLCLIGLMNTADRSLAMVDYALRRRFSFIPLRPMFDSDQFKSWLGARASKQLTDIVVNRLQSLNAEIEKDPSLGEGFSIGHSFFCPDDREKNIDENWYRRVVKFEIAPLLNEYWFDKLDHAKELIKKLEL